MARCESVDMQEMDSMKDRTNIWRRDELIRYGRHRLYYRWRRGDPVGEIEVFLPGGHMRKFSELRERAALHRVRCLSPAKPRQFG